MSLPFRITIGILLCALPGCDRAPDAGMDVSAAAAALFADPGRRAGAVGLGAEGGPPEALLADPLAARLTASGSHVVVLDRVPPFVRVFDRSGKLRAAFVGEGGGPTESRLPSTIAIAGDSLILFADFTRRLSLYDLDGNLRGQQSGLPLTVAAAVPGCDGEWFFYGARRERGSRAHRAQWLHRVRLGDPPRVESAFGDTIAGSIPVGLAYGFVRSGDGVLLRHELGSAPVAVRWECGSARPTTTPLPDAAAATEGATAKKGGRTAQLNTIQPGDRMQAGIAALAEGTIVADLVVGDGGRTTTRLRGTGPDGSWTATLPGSYVLRDSRPGVGVLVQADELVPHLFMLSESDLARMLEPGS